MRVGHGGAKHRRDGGRGRGASPGKGKGPLPGDAPLPRPTAEWTGGLISVRYDLMAGWRQDSLFMTELS